MTELEFWPEHRGGPLWDAAGETVDPSDLGLDAALVADLTDWSAAYAEDKLPVEGPGDALWLAHGRELLGRLRAALPPDHTIVVTEPWWSGSA